MLSDELGISLLIFVPFFSFCSTVSKNIKPVSRSLIIILQEALKNCWHCSRLEDELTALKIPVGTVGELIGVWKSYYHEVTKLLLSQTVAANALVDVDWSFGVTSASDSCDQVCTCLCACPVCDATSLCFFENITQIGRTYLQLKLTIDRGDIGLQDIFVELTLENFYHFLAQIEAISKRLAVVAS